MPLTLRPSSPRSLPPSSAEYAPAVSRWPAAWRRFWFEPWRWADPAWYTQAGVPPARYSAGSPALQRMLMAGWCSCFELHLDFDGLASGPPQSALWLDLFSSELRQLRLAARLVGWTLRLDVEPRYGAALADPARRQALHYLLAKPLGIALTESGEIHGGKAASLVESASDASTMSAGLVALGLAALERLAAIHTPAAHARVLMMLPPQCGMPWFNLSTEGTAASLEQQLAVARLTRLWQAAWRWAARPPDGARGQTQDQTQDQEAA